MQPFTFIFGKCKRPDIGITSIIYFILLVLGIFGIIFSYLAIEIKLNPIFQDSYNIKANISSAISTIFILVFAIATIIHQILVYIDLYNIDIKTNSAVADYGNWIDLRIERSLRALIILFLLFGVGKGADVIYAYTQYEYLDYIYLHDFRVWLADFIRPNGYKTVLSKSIFVKGSFCVFLFLFIWNCFAIYYRTKDHQYIESVEEQANYNIVCRRIKLFLYLSAICSLYWLFIWIDIGAIDIVANVTIGIYVFCFVYVLLMKSERFFNWLVKRQVNSIRKLRQLHDAGCGDTISDPQANATATSAKASKARSHPRTKKNRSN